MEWFLAKKKKEVKVSSAVERLQVGTVLTSLVHFCRYEFKCVIVMRASERYEKIFLKSKVVYRQ